MAEGTQGEICTQRFWFTNTGTANPADRLNKPLCGLKHNKSCNKEFSRKMGNQDSGSMFKNPVVVAAIISAIGVIVVAIIAHYSRLEITELQINSEQEIARLQRDQTWSIAQTETAGEIQTPLTPIADYSEQVEISYAIDTGILQRERVVIVSHSDNVVSLENWTLESKLFGYTYNFPNANLYAGGSIVVNTKDGVDNPLELFWGSDSAIWQSGDEISLRNNDDKIIDVFFIP